MRTIEQKADLAPAARRSISTYVSDTIQGPHLEKLAVVYQRPSLRVPYPRELTTPRARADL